MPLWLLLGLSSLLSFAAPDRSVRAVLSGGTAVGFAFPSSLRHPRLLRRRRRFVVHLTRCLGGTGPPLSPSLSLSFFVYLVGTGLNLWLISGVNYRVREGLLARFLGAHQWAWIILLMAAEPSSNLSSNVSRATNTETEDWEFISDKSLNYISQMLMEEDIDEKVSIYQEIATLRAAAKPFYDILGHKFPPSPGRQMMPWSLDSPRPQ